MGFNRVMLIGQAARVAKVRYIQERVAFGEFSLIVERPYRSAAGQDRTSRLEIAVVAYGALGERCGQVISEHAEIHVEGRLKLESWRDGDGTPRSRYVVLADRIEVAGVPVAAGAPAAGSAGVAGVPDREQEREAAPEREPAPLAPERRARPAREMATAGA